MRTFLYADAKANKFWNITLGGTSFTVQFGRAGTAGQTQVKTFPDEAKAAKEHDKLVREKLAKGYHETTPVTAPSLRDALESALIETPDDLATHMAYADYLEEQGDPRGEFVRTQLALESPHHSAERKALQDREKTILETHQAEWVGDWPALVEKSGPEGRGQHDLPTPTFGFERGILTTVTIPELTVECARSFVRAPQTRFVRRLYLGGFAYEEDSYAPGPDIPPDIVEDFSQQVLFHWPYLSNLRVFQLGWTSIEEYDESCGYQCHLSGDHAHDLVKRMPRIEELYLFAHRVDGPALLSLKMPHLRIVQLYHSEHYGLLELAANPSLGKLTHLLCHPHALEEEPSIQLPHLHALVHSPHLKSLTHLRLRLADFGDEGVEEIVRSGILKRLKTLDLRHGRISDAGARLLAGCPDAKGLNLLDLSRNGLTAEGVAALNALGIPVETAHQHGSTTAADPDSYEAREYLSQGDYE